MCEPDCMYGSAFCEESVSDDSEGPTVRPTHLSEEVRPLDIDSIGRVKIMLRRVGQVLHGQDSRIRDKDVDLAELVDSLLDHLLDI